MFLFDEGPTLETLDITFYIGSTPIFYISYLSLTFYNLYLSTLPAYAAAHYVYFTNLNNLFEIYSLQCYTDSLQFISSV